MDHVSNEGGYTLGHRKLRNFFLKENGWNICKLALTRIRDIWQIENQNGGKYDTNKK